ncbi:unnamed protein product [Brassicogethes aeneus]|uniref:Uncharacterized protein n=1 Tax=Brassicogethes aeneus TaxID=1431903 RepID=A0A9P0B5X3_BRAAE|nr:unnamed protein product [Brassicogethes aeneus]
MYVNNSLYGTLYEPKVCQFLWHTFDQQQNERKQKLRSRSKDLNFFSYETSDGSQREEKAELKNAGSKNEAISVQGSYTYVGTDGITYKVTYIADENGYRATGEHLPKNP